MDDSIRPHLSQEQLDQYANFTDERAHSNLALGIEGVPNYEHFVQLFSKAVHELAKDLATVACRGGTRIASIYKAPYPRTYRTADFIYRRAEHNHTNLTWYFHVPSLRLNAFQHGNVHGGYWVSVEPGEGRTTKTIELLAGPRVLSCKTSASSPARYPQDAHSFMREGYSFTTGMSFPANERTLPLERLRLKQRNGDKAENLDAPTDHVIFDVHHTYSVKVGQHGHTREYTNHLVVKFVLEEENEARQVPVQFYAIRRTDPSSSSLALR